VIFSLSLLFSSASQALLFPRIYICMNIYNPNNKEMSPLLDFSRQKVMFCKNLGIHIHKKAGSWPYNIMKPKPNIAYFSLRNLALLTERCIRWRHCFGFCANSEPYTTAYCTHSSAYIFVTNKFFIIFALYTFWNRKNCPVCKFREKVRLRHNERKCWEMCLAAL
jgi:hypothetical protein